MIVVGFALLLAGCNVWLDQARGLQRDVGPEAGSLVFGGRTRTYLLHLPPAYDGTAPLPLVIFLHGGGGNAQGAVSRYGFNEVADREGFIVAYPNGTGVLRDRVLTWNAGHCCGYALERDVNDVGFLRALIEKLEAGLNVDGKRVYVTGHSNGGMMAYRAGAELSDLIAAIAPVAGSIGGQAEAGAPQVVIPQPGAPVSVVAFHGLLDSHVLYGGGHGVNTSGTRVDLSVADSIAFWVHADGCDPAAQTQTSASVIVEMYVGCAGGSEVTLYTVTNGGHSWPGSSFGEGQTQEISATNEVWEFFKRHTQ